MFHDLVGQIQAVREFDQSPANLTTRCIPPHDDVSLEIGDDTCGSVTSLDGDSFEEEVHGVDESLLKPRGTFSREASPETKRKIEWLAVPVRRREIQTFSRIFRRESWGHTCRVGGKWS